MKTLNVREAITHFSNVMDQVEQGETVLICRRNLPAAIITPVAPDWASKAKHHTVIGWAKGIGACIHAELTEPVLAETDWDMMKCMCCWTPAQISF